MTLQIIDQGILSHQSGRGAYMPIITPLADGQTIASQHVGQTLGSADSRIEILRSSDGGKNWQVEDLLNFQQTSDGWAYRGPEICQIPDGRLLMTATRFENNGQQLFDIETEGLQRPELLLFWSQDQGHSWSAPHTVEVDLPPERYTRNGAGRFLQAASDRWLYFFETWKPQGYSGPPDQKAALMVSSDRGKTWGGMTVVADDSTGAVNYWDQLGCLLADGRIYQMFWVHQYGTSEDLVNHWSISSDQGHSWTEPLPTNLRGQVCAPIALGDGRVAAIYNFRHSPQGIRLAVSEDFSHFDLDNEIVLFDAGAEAALGEAKSDQFLEEHQLIGFGKPGGHLEADGTLLTYFWCTVGGVTHTRWARVRV